MSNCKPNFNNKLFPKPDKQKSFLRDVCNQSDSSEVNFASPLQNKIILEDPKN